MEGLKPPPTPLPLVGKMGFPKDEKLLAALGSSCDVGGAEGFAPKTENCDIGCCSS